MRRTLQGLLAGALLAPAAVTAQTAFDEALVSAFEYRNMGPFRIGARTSDIASAGSSSLENRNTFYLGTWTGGLWKTTDAGTTFRPIFDDVGKITIGDVTLAPSDPDVVWVGTGDAFTSRSSYAGDGVWRSTDAGETWTHLGLEDTHHIARIRVHPRDPDVAYVAAMGHLYSTNEERGVYKTTDGGRTWDKVLYIDERIGVIDLVMNPRDPDVLYAATYDKVRLPWQLVNGGPLSGIHKTTDGGRSWTRLQGGLPTGRIGRIGLDLYAGDPDVVYAVIENANPAPGARPDERGRTEMVGGEVYRTEDGGTTWMKMNRDEDDVSDKGPYYFSQIRVDPNDPCKLFVTGVSLGNSTDCGRTWHDITWPPRRLFSDIFGDVRTFWIDPWDSDHVILGSDGGVYSSYDGGVTSLHHYNIPLGEYYTVAVDMEDPYNIYAGLQDHDNWKGPSNGPMGEITLLDWMAVGSGDGMFNLPDTTDDRWLYTTLQYGGHYRVDQEQGHRVSIRPREPEGREPYRFIWATPLALSPHDSRTLYTGGQYLLKSTDRGETWEEISPDLSTSPPDRILPNSEGGIPGGINWFAASSIAESPVAAGVIWAGTSDGKVWVTRDGGDDWFDATGPLVGAGASEVAYVSRVRPSHHASGRTYVTKRGYKFDDFTPYVYRTDDYGRTWTSLASNLPDEPINVVWEDRVNPDLLFVGNDEGVFVTIDGGRRWVKMNNNMPSVPVHDLLVHPRENDLVLGSYGRGIWVTDVAPLQELDATVLASDAHLFRVEPTVQRVTWSLGANDYLQGSAHIVTPNEPGGMMIRYWLKEPAAGGATVTVTDASGAEVARLDGEARKGINTVVWSTRRPREGRGPGSADPMDAWFPPGAYTVSVEVAGRTLRQTARITGTQGWSIGRTPTVIR